MNSKQTRMEGTFENAIPLSSYPKIWSHWFTYMFSTLKQ